MTPLGARTPLAHPALYGVIVLLSLVIVVGAAWVFWPKSAVAPEGTPTPSPSVSSAAPAHDPSDYLNIDYGLFVALPDEWTGHGVTIFEWSAEDVTSSASDRTVAKGPLIHIVDPAVAGGNPRQDIPIMVFTLEQWGHVGGVDGDWSVSAAPIPPSELARNSTYVFALPARYNYAFPPGWEEVDQLIKDGAVRAFEP